MSEKRDIAMWAILAGAGGVARFLAGRLVEGAVEISLHRFIFLLIANILVSGFSGVMGALMMAQISPDVGMHHAAAGIFGFLGAKGIEVLSDKLANKL